jgi:3-methyladenine DNA glycosylase/8-oxoguanine DNA glycosylase
MGLISLPIPAGFQFTPTVLSHGWCELPPFSWDPRRNSLERIQQLADGRVVSLIFQADAARRFLSVHIEGLKGRMGQQTRSEIIEIAKQCLGLDQDLENFYSALRERSRYEWVEKRSAGRILTAPTVWEDAAKTLLTTNTTWASTTHMCSRLVTLGSTYKDGRHSFPTPEQVASLGLDELSTRIRIGYRSSYLHKLATDIVHDKVNVEVWRQPGLTSEELYDHIMSLKGFGDYAAGTMLRLLGKFDRLAIDTSCRSVFKEQINGGNRASDGEILDYYRSFGEWRGLVMWMDVMKVNLLKNLDNS